MGYSRTLGDYSNSFQIGSFPTKPSVELSTVATDYDIGSITLPSSIEIDHVYVDIGMRAIGDNSGATNYVNFDCSTSAVHVGVGSQGIGTIPRYSLSTPANTISPGTLFFGQNDVEAVFFPGEATTIKLLQLYCLADHLTLYDVQAVARIVVK